VPHTNLRLIAANEFSLGTNLCLMERGSLQLHFGTSFQSKCKPTRFANNSTQEKKMITPLAATANETDLLTYEVSDEALEIAAGAASEQVNFTLGSCTGLSECPG